MPFLITVDAREAVGPGGVPRTAVWRYLRWHRLYDSRKTSDCVSYSAAPAIFFSVRDIMQAINYFLFVSRASGKASIKNGKTFIRLEHFFRSPSRSEQTRQKSLLNGSGVSAFLSSHLPRIFTENWGMIHFTERDIHPQAVQTPSKLVVQIIMAEIYFRWWTFSIKLFLLRRSSCGNLSSRPSNHFV